MCSVIWQALGKVGIVRDDPSTWTKTRPEHLQHLKSDPAFGAIGTERTIDAIRQVLEGQALPLPKNWGAFFLHFPTGGEWAIPSSGWHMDGDYTGALMPPCGILIHAMLNDVAARCGGTNILSGSHRLVHRWFTEHPPAPGAPGDRTLRIARFHEQVEEIDGIPLQVVENTAAAGDLILMHSLLLHAVPAAHLGEQPRFVLSSGMHVPYWESAPA